MKKVLYLHGLESKQGGKKVDYLAKNFIVHAPEVDYNDPFVDFKLFRTVIDFQPELIIGSSMGGYAADNLAKANELPAILFNPALHSRSFEPLLGNGNAEEMLPQKRKIVVLGKQDDVIPAEKTKEMLEGNENYQIVEKDMGHRTDLNIFIDVIEKYVYEL